MDAAKIAENCKKQRDMSNRGLSRQKENTETCWNFYLADQMTYSDRIQFMDTWGRNRRASVNFNKVQNNVDAVVGFFAQNERIAKYIARLNQDQGQQLYSKNMNALKDYHRENTNASHLENEQKRDMMVNGYGAVDTDMSYITGNSTTMPNGEIIKEKIDPGCLYWDPSAKSKNLLDARWIGYYKDYDLKDALDLFQGSKDEDFEQVSDSEPSDLGYVFNPYGGIYDKIKMSDTVEWASKDSETVRVYNHQWMVYETFYKAANPLYEATEPLDAMFMKMKMDAIKDEIELPGDTEVEDMFVFDPTAEVLVFDESTKRKLVKQFGNLIQPIPFKRKVFYTAVVSGTHVFTWFKSICQQGFSINVMTGTWNRTQKFWMGMVNAMIEPQKYWNKAFTELMYTIASNSKGGVIIEEDAVDDVADFETKYAKTDGVVVVNSGAVSGQKIQDKARPALPTGLDTILQFAEQGISQNGVDPTFLGDITKQDTSGVLYKRVIRQVISKFAMYFDSIILAQKTDARLMGDLIPVWVENNQGNMVRITGEDGADEFIMLSKDMLAPEYDVTIQEAAQASDEKQETAIMLSSAAQNLMAVGATQQGISFLSESLQFYQLDGDVRSRLTQALQPKDQVDPQQFAMMQQQLQTMQQYIQSGELEKKQSETAKNNAQAQVYTQQISKTQAETARTLEEANRTAVEVTRAQTAPEESVSVSI